MGTYLGKPKTEKVSEDGENHKLRYGLSSMQGWRASMEDAHAAILDLDSSTSFFAVYDGHGGKAVAKFCAKFLHKELLNDEEYKAGDLTSSFRRVFLRMDEMMRADKKWRELLLDDGDKVDVVDGFDEELYFASGEMEDEENGVSKEETDPHADEPSSGCTACAVLVRDNKLIVANAGDSRCVMSKGGQALELSKDHKPELEVEQERILKAGGFIHGGRVNGSLNLARAIGDMKFKRNKVLPAEEQIVTANPDIRTVELSDDAEFIAIACDGIWDCMSSQELVDFVREQLKSESKLSAICETVFDKCLAPSAGGEGCDNMTMILIQPKKSLTSTSARAQLAKKMKTAAPKRITRGAPTIQKKPAANDDDAEVHIIPDPLTTSTQPSVSATQKRKQSTTAISPEAEKDKEPADVSSKKARTDAQTPPSISTESQKQKQQQLIQPSRSDARSIPTTNVPPFIQRGETVSIVPDEDADLFYDNPSIKSYKLKDELLEVGCRVYRVLRWAHSTEDKINKLRERVKELKLQCAEKDKLGAASAPKIKELEEKLKAIEVLSEKRWKASSAEIRNRERLTKEKDALVSELEGTKKQIAELESKLKAAECKLASVDELRAELEAEKEKVTKRDAFIDELQNTLIPEACAEYCAKGEEGVKTIIDELFPEGSDPPFPWAELEKRENERDAAEAAGEEQAVGDGASTKHAAA